MIWVAGSGRSGTRRRGNGRGGNRVVLVVLAAQLERLHRPLRRSHVLRPQRKLLRLKDVLRRRTVLSHPVVANHVINRSGKVVELMLEVGRPSVQVQLHRQPEFVAGYWI